MRKTTRSGSRLVVPFASPPSRRRLLQALTVAGGAAASRSLPEQWMRPVIDSVVLPAHAQTSPEGFLHTCSIEDFRVPFSATKTGSETEIAGIYTGTQDAAGPFFGDCQQTGVGFEAQTLRVEITELTQNRRPVNAATRFSSHGDQYEVRFFLNNVLIFVFVALIVIGTIFLFERTREIVFNGLPAREFATYQFLITPGANALNLSGFLLATLLVNETAGP